MSSPRGLPIVIDVLEIEIGWAGELYVAVEKPQALMMEWTTCSV